MGHTPGTQLQVRAALQHRPSRQTSSANHATACLQLPRKIPIKLEPKAFFANERTFLSWVNMAVALTATSSVLTSLSLTRGDIEAKGPIKPRTVAIISMVLVPLSAVMLFYAYYMYVQRDQYMRKKLIGFYDDKVGPVVITALIAIMLLTITFLAYWSYFTA